MTGKSNTRGSDGLERLDPENIVHLHAQAAAASTLTSAYNANQPYTQQITDNLRGLLPDLTPTIGATTQGVSAAANYDSNVLGGQYLSSGNPYLSGIINSTDADVANQVQSQFSAAGRTGSGSDQYALAKALAQNENSLRYNDYNTQLSRMDSAAANVGSLNSSTIASLLGLSTTAAGLPLQQAQQYASGIGSLNIGGSTSGTSTNSGSLLGGLGGLVGLGTDVAGLGGKLGLWNLK